MAKPRLRAKTGCLTCRIRKIKCDECRPCCGQCARVSRSCNWPTPEDLYDRRHRHRSVQSTPSPPSLPASPSIPAPAPVDSPAEGALLHHYAGAFVPVLLVPGAEGRFFESLRSYIFGLMREDPHIGLQSAVLACAASNQFILTGHAPLRQQARRYYTRAVAEVHAGVQRWEGAGGKGVRPPLFPLLVAVIFIYIDGFWGRDTAADALMHITGAMQLLHLHVATYEEQGLPSDCVLSPSRPYDRIAVESILYQAFLSAVRHPFAAAFPLDIQMLIRTERLLDTFFAAGSASMSCTGRFSLTAAGSPVLGAPVPLFRLTLAVVAYCHAPWRLQPDTLAEMRASLDEWEAACAGETDDNSNEPNTATYTGQPEREVAVLFVLMASLLLDAVCAAAADTDTVSTRPVQDFVVTGGCWQVRHALALLRRTGTAERCSGCYLAVWPLMVLGYAVTHAPDDAALVRKLLRRIRHRLGYGESQRMLDDLEVFWRAETAVVEKSPASLTNSVVCVASAGLT